jgi:hypothetical protein
MYVGNLLACFVDCEAGIACRYATFAALAGVSSADPRAAAAGLPPPDSLDVWGYISGAVDTSPRTSFQVDEHCIVTDGYKLLTGKQKGAPGKQYAFRPVWISILSFGTCQKLGACWAGPHVPNASRIDCTSILNCSTGCLYNIFEDPLEQRDLAPNPAYASRLAAMQTQLLSANNHIFSPDRGTTDPRACAQVRANGGCETPLFTTALINYRTGH